MRPHFQSRGYPTPAPVVVFFVVTELTSQLILSLSLFLLFLSFVSKKGKKKEINFEYRKK